MNDIEEIESDSKLNQFGSEKRTIDLKIYIYMNCIEEIELDPNRFSFWIR